MRPLVLRPGRPLGNTMDMIFNALFLAGISTYFSLVNSKMNIQEPFVDVAHSGNVSAQLGQTASLRCRVYNKMNFTVSWFRHRDLHLLTVGHYTYTTDQRYRALHEASTSDWVLLISSLQPRDAGLYECQIATTPPKRHFVYLDIMEPVTNILGGRDLHINLGSPLNLTCLVLYHAKPPDVIWFHEGEIVEYTSVRGGISVVTESGESTRSSLLISQAKKSDAGNYTCAAQGGHSTTTHVHVLSGENRAAMYSSATQLFSTQLGWLPYFLLGFIFQRFFEIAGKARKR